MPECRQRLLGLLAPRRGCRNRNNRVCAQPGLHTTRKAPALHALPRSYTGPSYLDDFESICLEEDNSASPVARGYHMPLWVEGNAVQGLGTGVLESQLSTDCVPQLEERRGIGTLGTNGRVSQAQSP